MPGGAAAQAAVPLPIRMDVHCRFRGCWRMTTLPAEEATEGLPDLYVVGFPSAEPASLAIRRRTCADPEAVPLPEFAPVPDASVAVVQQCQLQVPAKIRGKRLADVVDGRCLRFAEANGRGLCKRCAAREKAAQCV